MDEHKGFRIVGKDGGSGAGAGGGAGQAGDQGVGGITGFYYVTPTDSWDDPSLHGRRSYAWLFTLPSYILRELLKGVILAATVFSVILIAVFAGQVMKDGVGVLTLAKVVPNFLPLICPFVLPLAILTGILVCYSRLSKDNEVLAAYAGGINPFWLMLPALLTSVLAIFITLTLNEVAMMPAIRNIERMVVEDQANILRRMISRPGSITVLTGSEYLAMSKMDPNTEQAAGKSPLDITRFGLAGSETEPGGGLWNPKYPFPAKRVVARDHAIQEFSDNAGSELVMKMSVTKPIVQDLHVSDINRTFIAYGESGEERIALGGKPNVTIHSNRAVFWPILMLSETRREAEDRIRELDSANTRLEDMPAAQRDSVQAMRERLYWVVMNRTGEINMRLALCFSCLSFAFLGIPLGMRTRGTLVASFVVGILTAGLYFLVLKSAEVQVSRANMPWWVIWVPDVAVVALGVLLWVFGTRKT